MQELNNRALAKTAPQNTTVDIVHGSTTSVGNKPPNKDEPAPVSNEQEALQENDNFHKATKQSLTDAMEVAKREYTELRTKLNRTEVDVKLLGRNIDAKSADITKIRAKQVNANNRENTREATALIGINEKWQSKQMLSVISAGTPAQNRLLYEKAVDENNRQAEIAMAVITQYTKEIDTLTTEREDLRASLTIAQITVTSLTRQLAEAETVRKEKREELQTLCDIEQIEQQEALETAQQQQQSIQQSDSSQSQQPSSSDDQVPQQQLSPPPHQQPPPPQLSGVQLQQQTPASVTQQTNVPSTADTTSTQAGTSIQSVKLTEEALSKAEPMDQTLPNRGPPSSSNEPMSLGQSSESTSSHDDHMKSLDTSFEQHRLDSQLPPEQGNDNVLDNYPQAGFDPAARVGAPSPAESAVTLRYQGNLFRHSAESSAFQSATTSPYGSSNLNASAGPTDSSQPLYNEMLELVQAAAALAPGNSQQPTSNERQNLATSAADIMDRLRLRTDGNLGWPAQQTPAQSQHPANLSSGHLPHAPPVSGYTAMGSVLHRQQSAPYPQHQQQQVTPQQHQQMVIQQQLQQQMPYQQQLLAVQQQQHQQLVPQQQRMSTPQLYQSSWLPQPSHYAVPEINPGQSHQQGLVLQPPQFQHSTPLHSRPTTPSQQFPQAPQGLYGNFVMPGMLPQNPSLPQQYPGQQPQRVQQQYAPQPQVMPHQHQAAPQQWNAHQQPAQLHQAAPSQQVEPPYQVAPPVWNIPTTTAANSQGNATTTTTSGLHVQVSPETERKYREELNIIMAQLEKNAKVYDEAKATEREKLAVIEQLEKEDTAEDTEATDFDVNGKGMMGCNVKLTAVLEEHHYAMRAVNSSRNTWEKLAGKRKAWEDILAACKVVPEPEPSVTPLSQALLTPPTTPHQGSTSKHSEPEVGRLIDIEEVTGGDESNNNEDSLTDVDPGVWIQPPRDRAAPLKDPSHYEYFTEEDDAKKPHNPQPQSENFSPVIANHGFPADAGSRGPYYLRLDAYFTKMLSTMNPDPNFRLTKNIEKWFALVKRVPKYCDDMHDITLFLRMIRKWEPVLRYLIRERAYPEITPVQYDLLLRYIATKLQAECGRVFDKEYAQFCTPDPAIVITIGFNRILRATGKGKMPCASVVQWLTHNCGVNQRQMDEVSEAVELMNAAKPMLDDKERHEHLKDGELILERARTVYGLFKHRILEVLATARQDTPDSQPHAEQERKRKDDKEKKEKGSD